MCICVYSDSGERKRCAYVYTLTVYRHMHTVVHICICLYSDSGKRKRCAYHCMHMSIHRHCLHSVTVYTLSQCIQCHNVYRVTMYTVSLSIQCHNLYRSLYAYSVHCMNMSIQCHCLDICIRLGGGRNP